MKPRWLQDFLRVSEAVLWVSDAVRMVFGGIYLVGRAMVFLFSIFGI